MPGSATSTAAPFEVEPTLEGVGDRLDQLADLLQHRLAEPGLLVLAAGATLLDLR
jgi:hypothetical protein